MGVDSSGLISDLPKPLIRWFANLAGAGKGKGKGQYKVIEVPVEDLSDEYFTINPDGSITINGDSKRGKRQGRGRNDKKEDDNSEKKESKSGKKDGKNSEK